MTQLQPIRLKRMLCNAVNDISKNDDIKGMLLDFSVSSLRLVVLEETNTSSTHSIAQILNQYTHMKEQLQY